MTNKSIAVAAAEGRTIAPVHTDRLARLADLATLLNRCDSLNAPVPVGSIADVASDTLQIVRIDPHSLKAMVGTILELIDDLATKSAQLDTLIHGAAIHSHSQKARTRAALESKALSTYLANRLEAVKEALSASYQPKSPAGDL